MVLGSGHFSLFASQNSFSSGYSFSFPRLGCFHRSRLISCNILSSHKRFLFCFGAFDIGFRLSSFPPPFFSLLCQSKRVRLFVPKASSTALVPYFSQKASILVLSFACSVIIYRKRITLSQVETKPFVPRNLLKIRIFFSFLKSAICLWPYAELFIQFRMSANINKSYFIIFIFKYCSII